MSSDLSKSRLVVGPGFGNCNPIRYMDQSVVLEPQLFFSSDRNRLCTCNHLNPNQVIASDNNTRIEELISGYMVL